jgi:hypothetical protein
MDMGSKYDYADAETRRAVETNREEFLILKFDKCTIRLQIAETCIASRNAIYWAAAT